MDRITELEVAARSAYDAWKYASVEESLGAIRHQMFALKAVLDGQAAPLTPSYRDMTGIEISRLIEKNRKDLADALRELLHCLPNKSGRFMPHHYKHPIYIACQLLGEPCELLDPAAQERPSYYELAVRLWDLMNGVKGGGYPHNAMRLAEATFAKTGVKLP